MSNLVLQMEITSCLAEVTHRKQTKPTKERVGKGNKKSTRIQDKKGSKGGEEDGTPTVL